jgi:hypothetical protein
MSSSEDGATALPAIETDTVAGLYVHLMSRRWSNVISHAWLHMFGVPDGMRVVPVANPVHGPRVGLVIAGRSPVPMQGQGAAANRRRDRRARRAGRTAEKSSQVVNSTSPDRRALSRHSEFRFDARGLA